MKPEEIFAKRDQPATLIGETTKSVRGENIPVAPCDLLLGNAIVQLALADQTKTATDRARIRFHEGELDCDMCRLLYARYGERLNVPTE
jgi:hypothetical protein